MQEMITKVLREFVLPRDTKRYRKLSGYLHDIEIQQLAQAIITAIREAEIEKDAFELAAKTYWEKRNSKAEFTDMLTSVITAYIQHAFGESNAE